MPNVYTRTGDKGDTGLFGGSRVPKQSLRVEAYGTVDETNSALGAAKALMPRGDWRDRIHAVQQRLFVLAAELASDPKGAKQLADPITIEDVTDLETLIDDCLAITGKQREFVVPGRDQRSASLHFARTVSRRAERRVLILAEDEPVRPELIKYLNRLSDAIYALARLAESWADRERVEQIVRDAVTKFVAGGELAEASADSSLASSVAAPAVSGAKPVDTAEGEVNHDDHPGTLGSYNLDIARVLCAAAQARAKELGIPVAFAAVDASGGLLLFERMPDTLLASTDIACNKAWTAAAFKLSTEAVGKASQPGAPLYGIEAGNDGRVVLFGGGEPIWVAGQLAGGIGVSGGTVEEDIDIIHHALNCISGVNQ